MEAQEKRQYLKGLMEKSITRYREGSGDLAALVSDVESLIDSLFEVADSEWVEELRTAWWELEVPYAASLSEERPPTLQELRDVNVAVRSIELVMEHDEIG